MARSSCYNKLAHKPVTHDQVETPYYEIEHDSH